MEAVGIPARSGQPIDEVAVACTPAFHRGFEDFGLAPDATIKIWGLGLGFETLDHVNYGRRISIARLLFRHKTTWYVRPTSGARENVSSQRLLGSLL